MPEQNRFEQLCDSIAARLENAGITETTLQSTLPEVRERLTRRRYPELFSDEKRQPASKRKASGVKGKRKS